MTFSIVLISFGSTLLSLVVALALWTRIRVLRATNDLLQLRINLRRSMQRADALLNSDFRDCDEGIARTITVVENMTTSNFIHIMLKLREQEKVSPYLNCDPQVREILEVARHRASARLVLFYLLETVSGLFLTCAAVIVYGLVMSKKMLKRSSNLIEIDTFQHEVHA